MCSATATWPYYETRETRETEQRGPLTFFNPGAAGKRRFKVVPSIGLLDVGPGRVEGRILVL